MTEDQVAESFLTGMLAIFGVCLLLVLSGCASMVTPDQITKAARQDQSVCAILPSPTGPVKIVVVSNDNRGGIVIGNDCTVTVTNQK